MDTVIKKLALSLFLILFLNVFLRAQTEKNNDFWSGNTSTDHNKTADKPDDFWSGNSIKSDENSSSQNTMTEFCSQEFQIRGTCIADGPKPGVGFKICKIGEHEGKILLIIKAYPINGGILSYKYKTYKLITNDPTFEISVDEFNNQGFVTPQLTYEKEYDFSYIKIVWSDKHNCYIQKDTDYATWEGLFHFTCSK